MGHRPRVSSDGRKTLTTNLAYPQVLYIFSLAAPFKSKAAHPFATTLPKMTEVRRHGRHLDIILTAGFFVIM